MNITLVKILKYSIYLILGISILYLIYFINTEDPLKKKLRRELKSIYKNNTFSKHLLNDYREEFLPNTQFIKLEYKKIDLDFLNINPCYFGSCYTFFLEQKDDKLIILDRKGNLKITSIDDLDKNSIQFTDVKTNLNFDYVLDVLIKGNEIFITGKKI